MVLNLALIGLAITLDPLPLTAFIAVPSSKRGVTKGAAFVLGWLLSLAIVVTVTVLATGDDPPEPSTAPSLAGLAAKVAIGVVLVTIAIRHLWARGRPKPPKKPPKWQEHVDGMSPWFALGLAPALQPWAPIGAGAVVEAKAIRLGELPRAVRVLPSGLGVVPLHGDLHGLQARPKPGAPGQVPDLD